MSDAKLLPRIHPLSESLANQISAGEVIERPASVVKELLENSLDADATNIRIDIEKGGVQSIKINDNGTGIHKNDLLLAIDRHATSKINSIEDLIKINSLGFRGEALASIAAVSKLKIISCYQGQEHAYELVKDPRQAQRDIQPASHPPGTLIEIKDLFFNMPVRKKFLRSERTEYLHILALVKALALTRFNTDLRLIHNGRLVFKCFNSQNDPARRILEVCGKSFIENTGTIEYEQNQFRLWGWLGHSQYTRNQTDYQYVILNGRIIRDRQVNHAIRLAYQDLIYPGKYPVFVLYLEMDPDKVDINVHPTKHEVRFRNQREVHDFIRSSLFGALNENNLISNNPLVTNNSAVNIREPVAGYKKNYYKTEHNTIDGKSYISVLDGQYLILDQGEKVKIIDIFQIRELILKNKLKKKLQENNLLTRPLLVPIITRLSAIEKNTAIEYTGMLKKFGISLEQTGPDSMRILEIPVILQHVDINDLIVNVLGLLHKTRSSDLEELMVCQIAKHANDGMSTVLSNSEIDELLNEITNFENRIQKTDIKKVVTQLDKLKIKNLFHR